MIVHGIGPHFAKHAPAVSPNHRYFIHLQLARAGFALPPAFFLGGNVVFVHQVHVRQADQFTRLVTEHARHGRIGEAHDAALDQEDTIAAVVEQHLVEVL